jgi:hypothetical protein
MHIHIDKFILGSVTALVQRTMLILDVLCSVLKDTIFFFFKVMNVKKCSLTLLLEV